jgi:RNA polymerase sigma-70 factor (ECF subfamily)
MKLIRSRGVVESRVEDMTHDFMLHLMTNSTLKRADRAKGRFRHFLCGALANVLSTDVKRTQAQKRGGDRDIVSLDAFVAGEPVSSDPSADADFAAQFDRAWVLAMIETALKKLAESYTVAGKADKYAVLKEFLPGGTAQMSGEQAAAALGMAAVTVRSEISRLREKFRSFLRSEIALTVQQPEEVDEELRYLFHVLQKS